MMEYEDQLKLQSFVDGELSEAEAAEFANRLARDQEAVLLVKELRQTRQAMAGFERGVQLPESREFYWSKIQREIERLEPPAREVARESFFARWRRLLAPLGGVAFAVAIGLITIKGLQGQAGYAGSETSVSDSSAFTYRDYSSGATLVWVSYPADDADSVDAQPDMDTVDYPNET